MKKYQGFIVITARPTEKEEEPSRGIPGLPYESIMLRVIAGVVILLMMQRRK